jgi:hypothetical protein
MKEHWNHMRSLFLITASVMLVGCGASFAQVGPTSRPTTPPAGVPAGGYRIRASRGLTRLGIGRDPSQSPSSYRGHWRRHHYGVPGERCPAPYPACRLIRAIQWRAAWL